MNELNADSPSAQINIEKQLEEIEILKSIYSNLNEFQIEDDLALLEAQVFVSSNKHDFDLSELNRKLGFIIKFVIEIDDSSSKTGSSLQLPLEIVCRLPTFYPLKLPPDVFVRCNNQKLNRKFADDLSKYVNSSHTFDSSILSIIDWIRENIHLYVGSDKNESTANKSNNIMEKNKLSKFTRMFIYSHHIYSVNKRRNIVQWARDLELKGFCMPGKPGIICVEGDDFNVQEYWSRLRALSWQKLQIKETQTFDKESNNSENEHAKFDNFEEKVFTYPNNDSNIDFGLLFAYLKQKNLDYVFHLYFGVDGKLPQSSNDT